MRSLSMYLVMKSIGYDVQILNQGYKTFRAYIRNFLENQVNKFCFNVLGGLTGSGKTYFLNLLSKKYNVLNLEKISKHKGSVLGDIPNEKQPTQKNLKQIFGSKFKNLMLTKKFGLNPKVIKLENYQFQIKFFQIC